MTNFYTLQAQQPNAQFGTPVFNNTPKAKAEQSLPIFEQAQAQMFNNPMSADQQQAYMQKLAFMQQQVFMQQQQAFMQQDRVQMMKEMYSAKEKVLGKIGVESLADKSISLMAQKLHDAGTPSEVHGDTDFSYIGYKNSKGEEAGYIRTGHDGKPGRVTIYEGAKSHYFEDFNGDDIIDTAVTTTTTKGAQEKDATLILPNKAVRFFEDGFIHTTTAYDGARAIAEAKAAKEDIYTAPIAEVEKEDIYTAPKAEIEKEDIYTAPKAKVEKEDIYTAPKAEVEKEDIYTAPRSEVEKEDIYTAPKAEKL